MKKTLKNLLPAELEAFIAGLGERTFRAKQLLEWMYGRCASSFDQMTNLPAALRTRLAEVAELDVVTEVGRQLARDGTTKFLFRLCDGKLVESVLMPHDYGHSVCVSSQVGCRMGCRFCASALSGLERNLTAAEMIDQVVHIQRSLPAGERVRSLVVMGMGEPLENYDAVVRFLRLLHLPEGLNIGYRHVTVSTCGLVPGILRLAQEQMPITLAVSLHAPNDMLRERLMPVNRKYSIEKVLEAAGRYAEITGRRVTFEYILIHGQNDAPEQAHELGRLLRGRLSHINLIPANPVPERGIERPPRPAVEAFQRIVSSYGIETTVRREMGSEIDAACGQLRRRAETGQIPLAICSEEATDAVCRPQ